MKLFCNECKEAGKKQPAYFYESWNWKSNKVNAEGECIGGEDGELGGYSCPTCGNTDVEEEEEED